MANFEEYSWLRIASRSVDKMVFLFNPYADEVKFARAEC